MKTETNQRPFSGDDIAVWPNGEIADLRDVWNGHYDHMSDDYERVRLEDEARLAELGIDLNEEHPG